MKRTYWITAGHGGTDPGAIATHYGVTYREADLALELRELVSEHLRRWGHTVNNEGNATPLVKVVQWFKQAVGVGDIVLDIHWNAGSSDAHGTEAFVQMNPDATEVRLANALCGALETFGFRNRGLKLENQTRHGRLGILDNNGHAVLLEVCFITNADDMGRYEKAKHQIAAAIASTLSNAV